MGGKKLDGDQPSFYCWLFCVVTVLSLSGLLSWLSLTPKNPRFRISVEPIRESLPNGTLIVDLELTNPNKRMGIYYNGITLTLLSGGDGLWRNSTPGFYQGYNHVTTFQVPVPGSREYLQGIQGGNASFAIRVETDVRFRIMRWKTKVHSIEHEEQLNDLKISSVNGTNLSGGDYAELRNASTAPVRY